MSDKSIWINGTPEPLLVVAGTIEFREVANAAGDLVWATALVTPNGQVYDMGTIPVEAHEGQRVQVRIERINPDRHAAWGGTWADEAIEARKCSNVGEIAK